MFNKLTKLKDNILRLDYYREFRIYAKCLF